MKQYAPSCDRNKAFILEILKEVLPVEGIVLEIGSGTGQHAVYFAEKFPRLTWQPTDLAANFPSIRAWSREAGKKNLLSPLELNLLSPLETWPVKLAHAVVCINTIHIVSWMGVQNLFAGAARVLEPGGLLYLYGAIRYGARSLEPSNIAFDELLRARDPLSGLRKFEELDLLAQKHGMRSHFDRPMPGNNRSLGWIKN